MELTNKDNYHKVFQNLCILRTLVATNPDYGKGLSIKDCCKAVEWVDDAIAMINALWRDLDKARPCFACKNQSKCDPNDDGFKQRFWVACGGSRKLKWEWSGNDG